ncbi:hypothetical protein DPMN_023186 [Dreissena polymorpha]|uniref:Uncharacterized protein n=1 Tax=Dreissena polymorpha TaxID=45954 RepID=A0A9D4LP63_DREPO|nr:hypothetical protein DPMN_023186 [Dreissena polymorpha]
MDTIVAHAVQLNAITTVTVTVTITTFKPIVIMGKRDPIVAVAIKLHTCQLHTPIQPTPSSHRPQQQ